MKTLQKYFAIFLLMLSPLTFAQYFVAPIGSMPDPDIVYYDGWYYYMGTAGADIKMKRAQTLEGLKGVNNTRIFGPTNEGPCCKYWAPELHRVNNKWYIYYTAQQKSTDPQHMWVIENSSDNPMEGTWINRGRIFDSANDFWAIDGTVFQLNDKLYYVYSGVAKASDGDKPQRLYIARMSNPWTLSGSRVLLSSPVNSWERDGLVNEGPSILQANGKTFLVYSGSGCWTPNYALGMLWIDDREDPMNPNSWEKLTQAVFSKDPSVDAYGPGHNSFFKSPDGKEVWMAYHATPNSAGACDGSRATFAKKITFNSSGFPVFGTPTRSGVQLTPPSGEVAVPFKGVIVNGTYKIQAASSTRPLDVAGCSNQRGANVQQWESNNMDCQKWHIQATEDGHYYITSLRGGLSMNIENCGTDNATNVQVWTPTGSDCQKWDFIPNDDGTYRIASVKSGKVLDIQFGGDNNGANLQIYSDLGSPQQHFHLSMLDALPEVETGWYKIISKRSSLALDTENCDGSSDNVIQSRFDNSRCQKWFIKKDANHFYSLLNNGGGMALEVANCAVNPGANVITGNTTNNECQQFSFVHVKDGWFTMIARTSGLAVDVAGCKTTDGQNIALWTNWQGDCQLWRFEKVEPYISVSLEAENAQRTGGVVFANNNSGYTGTGFVDYPASGGRLDFQSSVSISGSYLLSVRYANGSTSARVLRLVVNGINYGELHFDPSGSWNSWLGVFVRVDLKGGANTISLIGVASPAPDIDQISLSGGGTTLISSSSSRSSNPSNQSSSRSSSSNSGGTCASIPQYVDGNTYSANAVVKNLGNRYQCEIAGWCSIGGPYAPGAGWAWDNAWNLIGACN